MTTLEVEIALLMYYDITRNLIVHNVTNMSNITAFEVDLLVLSKSSYATAIEIKVSKPDLKNDLKKKHIKSIGTVIRGKRSEEIYYKNFKHFYYAVPEHLEEAALKQIPEFCGLLVIKEAEEYYITNKVIEVRKPKQLFTNKWSENMRYDLARLGTMRILNLKSNINELKKERNINNTK